MLVFGGPWVYSSCLLVVLQDKQSIAGQGHGLKFPNKSGTGSDGMGLWARSCCWESESGSEGETGFRRVLSGAPRIRGVN